MITILTFNETGTYQCDGSGIEKDLAPANLLRQTGCQDCPVFVSCRMSHWTQVETQITDLEALKKAARELGLDLTHDRARGYGNTTIDSDATIPCSGPYDIAVVKTPEGTYSLKTDWFQGHVAKQVGKDFGKLLQLYGVHKATQAAKLKGYSVARKAQGTKIVLTVTAH